MSSQNALRVYVAGPISLGNQFANVRAAIDAAQALLADGFVPFLPHLSAFWHVVHPNDYETWMRYDLSWLATCDAVLRLPGTSPGADQEEREATELGIPTFRSQLDLVAHRARRCP